MTPACCGTKSTEATLAKRVVNKIIGLHQIKGCLHLILIGKRRYRIIHALDSADIKTGSAKYIASSRAFATMRATELIVHPIAQKLELLIAALIDGRILVLCKFSRNQRYLRAANDDLIASSLNHSCL